MKKGKNNKKKVAVLAAALALLTLGAGTFAWTSYTEWVKNHLQSKGFEDQRVKLVEEFNPSPIDDPNGKAEMDKKVNVVNPSAADALVRISFEEMLHKLQDGAKLSVSATSQEPKAAFPVIVDNGVYGNTEKYDDITDLLIVTGNKNGTTNPVDGANATANLIQAGTIKDTDSIKLYRDKKTGEVQLVFKKLMYTADFPKDFDFQANSASIPTLERDFAQELTAAEVAAQGATGRGQYAYVAQKLYINGTILKTEDNPGLNDGLYHYTIDADKTKDHGLGFYDYGVGITNAPNEYDWAGVNQNVTASVTHQTALNLQSSDSGGVMTNSLADNGKIKLTQSNVTTFLPSTDEQKTTYKGKWYYNENDGYYYYLGVLKSGATTETSALDKITFPDVKVSGNESYKVSSYNLWVGLEAITASKVAMETASNGGKLTDAAISEGSSTWESNGAGWGLIGSDAMEIKARIANLTAKEAGDNLLETAIKADPNNTGKSQTDIDALVTAKIEELAKDKKNVITITATDKEKAEEALTSAEKASYAIYNYYAELLKK